MSVPNLYSVSPIINLVDYIDKRVQVSKKWFDELNQMEAFSNKKCVIMQRENFIGTVMHVYPPTDEVRVNFGNLAEWRDNTLWVPRSQVKILE